MTLRSIEMQIALPRVNEIGHVQNQLSQKPAYDQHTLAQQEASKSEENLKRSNEIDKTSTLLVGEDDAKRDGQRQNDQSKDRKRSREDNGSDKSEHPYKGRHIDLTL